MFLTSMVLNNQEIVCVEVASIVDQHGFVAIWLSNGYIGCDVIDHCTCVQAE